MELHCTKSFEVKDAELIFCNFSGKGNRFNREGDANFSIVLDDELAEKLLAEGWNVKDAVIGMEGPIRYIMVHLGGVSVSDQSYTNADVVVQGFEWEIGKLKGVKAYLHSMSGSIKKKEDTNA